MRGEHEHVGAIVVGARAPSSLARRPSPPARRAGAPRSQRAIACAAGRVALRAADADEPPGQIARARPAPRAEPGGPCAAVSEATHSSTARCRPEPRACGAGSVPGSTTADALRLDAVVREIGSGSRAGHDHPHRARRARALGRRQLRGLRRGQPRLEREGDGRAPRTAGGSHPAAPRTPETRARRSAAAPTTVQRRRRRAPRRLVE